MSRKNQLVTSLFIFCILSFCTAENAFYANIISPTDTSLFISGSETTVSFEFDEEAANAASAWLLIKFDSQVKRTIAGTSIESPISFKIDAGSMTEGSHLVEFLLIGSQSGKEETLSSAELKLDIRNLSDLSENSIYAEITSHRDNSEFERGEDVSLIFEFDEEAANAANAEIIFLFDDRKGEIKSPLNNPFVLDIPGRLMTSGEHLQRFILTNSVDGKDSILAFAELNLKVGEQKKVTENAFYAAVTSPAANPEYTAGSEAVITVEFDEDAANDKNAWLVVMFDDMNASTVFGTTIESPYSLDIPGKVMKTGNHMVRFLFMDKINGMEEIISSAEIELKVTD